MARDKHKARVLKSQDHAGWQSVAGGSGRYRMVPLLNNFDRSPFVPILPETEQRISIASHVAYE